MIELLNIDCMEYMATCKDKQFDLAIVDPPYGINVAKMAYTQEENRPCRQKNGSVLRVKKIKYRHGDWDKTPPADEYFDELIRISRDQIIWGVDHYDYDFPRNGRIKWNKHTPDGVSFNTYEYAYCSLIDGEVLFDYLWAGMCQAKSLKEPLIQQGNKQLNEKRIHPCHKPINLYKWLLKTYATPDMKIIDTHLGSGSSAIACYDFRCDFVGCEIDKEYYESAKHRLETYKLQTKLCFT